MGHKNKKSLVCQVHERLDEKLRIGESKHDAKTDGTAAEGVYSWSTYRTYIKHGVYFAKWAKATHDCRTLDQAEQYVEEYLDHRIDQGLSAWTIKLEKAALTKLYGKTIEKETPRRLRSDIKRSRGAVKDDRNFSVEKNQKIVDFCRSTGLRRSELAALKGNQLVEKNGKYFIEITGWQAKGGRPRTVEVIGDVDNVKNLCRAAGDKNVFERVPKHMDVHALRSEYCSALYKSLARPLEDIPRSEQYRCRKDLAGTVYDKRAMVIASKNLGHNRIDVIAYNYLRG